MSSIKINFDSVRITNSKIRHNKQKIGSTQTNLFYFRGRVDYRIRSRRSIERRLNKANEQADKIEKKLRNLDTFIQNSLDKYEDAEKKLNNKAKDIGTKVVYTKGHIHSPSSFFKSLDAEYSLVNKMAKVILASNPQILPYKMLFDVYNNQNYSNKKINDYGINNKTFDLQNKIRELNVGDAIIGSSKALYLMSKDLLEGKDNTISFAELSVNEKYIDSNKEERTNFSIGTIKVSNESNIEIGMESKLDSNDEEDNLSFGIEANKEIKVSGTIMNIENQVEDGLYSRESSMSVGTLEGSAKFGFEMNDDNNFIPAVAATAATSVTGISAETKVEYGTKDMNIHANAEVVVGKAEAYANLELDVLEGDVKAEVGASAAVFEGEVSGGIDLFGYRIDVGVGGQAVAFGAEAKAEIDMNTTSIGIGIEKVQLEAKLAVLAGASFKFSLEKL